MASLNAKLQRYVDENLTRDESYSLAILCVLVQATAWLCTDWHLRPRGAKTVQDWACRALFCYVAALTTFARKISFKFDDL